MIDTDKYEGHTEGPWESWSDYIMKKGNSWQEPIAEMDFNFKEADAKLIAHAPLLLAEVQRLRGLLDEINDVVYYNDKKAGQVLPVEKPNLELLRDIMMSYTDEAYQIRGDGQTVLSNNKTHRRRTITTGRSEAVA